MERLREAGLRKLRGKNHATFSSISVSGQKKTVWAGAGGHLGGGVSIRSSSDGQDEAIDTPSVLLRRLVRPVHTSLTAF